MSDQEIKINYCDTVGSCTAPTIDDETFCRYYKYLGCYRSSCCILRTWFAGCMSPEARAAAKETAKLSKTAIKAAE